jgi:arsenate reductase
MTTADSPMARGLLSRLGFPVAGLRSKPWDEFAEGREGAPAFAFAVTFRMLNNRISIFANLPFASLDRISLKPRLDRIGTLDDAAGVGEKTVA